MRTYIPVIILLLALFAAQSAEAQLRAEVPGKPAAVAIYDQPTPGFGLGQLFNAENFRVSHGYEFSYSNFGGEGIGLGVYSTALHFQPNDRLAARVALGVAHSPFGSSALQQHLGFGEDQPVRLFIQDATIAYRPTENSLITFSFQQSPYGGYYGPFGFSPYHGGSALQARFAPGAHDSLFWRQTDR